MKILSGIWRGQSLLRTLMNERCRTISLEGKEVLDLGAGMQAGSYHAYFQTPARVIQTADMKQGGVQHQQLNFETDALPFSDQHFDVVLSFNLFEHIYNHAHLLRETHRVTKTGGELIGFVPFLINYHPDPHDFFRYTKEALHRMFESAGYEEIVIKEIGKGPFSVNYNNIVLSVPRLVRIILYPFYASIDALFVRLRPKSCVRYPLGYFFTARKK